MRASFRQRVVVVRGENKVSTPLLVGACGKNTDSWSVSFAPRLEPVASRRVAQHSAGDCRDPSAMARPAHRQSHPSFQSAPVHPLTPSRPCMLSEIPCDRVNIFPTRSSPSGLKAQQFINIGRPSQQEAYCLPLILASESQSFSLAWIFNIIKKLNCLIVTLR